MHLEWAQDSPLGFILVHNFFFVCVNVYRKEEAIGLAQEYVRYSELKAGERSPASPVSSDPIKVMKNS